MWYTNIMLLAVDTGGTKTLIASFKKDGSLGDTFRFPTPANTNDYVSQVKSTIETHYNADDIEGVTIALPGIIENGVAIWCNNLGWSHFNAKDAFKDLLGGSVPIFIENDANLAGLSEARSIKPLPISVLYVTVSTGIGTGIITNGNIDPGTRKSEGGRTMVEFNGMIREWESFASGKAIYNTFEKFAHDITSVHDWNQVADRISRGLLAIIPVLQPNTIVIGGSIGTYFKRYGKQLDKILSSRLPSHIPVPVLREAKHPEEAVIYGCYYYTIDQLA